MVIVDLKHVGGLPSKVEVSVTLWRGQLPKDMHVYQQWSFTKEIYKSTIGKTLKASKLKLRAETWSIGPAMCDSILKLILKATVLPRNSLILMIESDYIFKGETTIYQATPTQSSGSLTQKCNNQLQSTSDELAAISSVSYLSAETDASIYTVKPYKITQLI